MLQETKERRTLLKKRIKIAQTNIMLYCLNGI